MDEQQKQAFEEAVERKKEESEARSRAQRPISGPPGEGGGVAEEIQSDLVDPGTTQDTFSIRDKNAGKGQKTADKWNQ
jgi:hypothetical protein